MDNQSKMNELTISEFKSLTVNDIFTEKEISKDKYRIELKNSWLICMVFIEGPDYEDPDYVAPSCNVTVLYLSSFYQTFDEQKKLMAYAGFVIGQRINKGVPFSEIEFEQR